VTGDLPPSTGVRMAQRPAVAEVRPGKGLRLVGIGANPKREIFSVKQPSTLFHRHRTAVYEEIRESNRENIRVGRFWGILARGSVDAKAGFRPSKEISR
jgi:hypothetical protein